ncbi:O-antigen ligase family protein [Glaciecola petra]|uniref:O-antigen ligase family protein n=1 Tax=Glaciecola petra TaxID=3075602 RepID=A0ABU2ZTL5_9ALTE|nr:O-antigen ligase family protein [Aestuariibacter sp. P117]MDT0595945.1 O-antigen ligase family protein [Aestuariibacter sp. P117]
MFKVGGIGFGAVMNLFMLVVLFAVYNHTRFKIHRMSMLWIPLILIMLISIAYTPYPVLGLRSLLVVITYMAMFLIPFHFVKSQQHFMECLKIIVYSSFIPLLAVFYEFAFPEGSTNRNGFRLFSTFTHPNIFAFYLVTVVSVCFFAIKSEMFKYEIQFKRLCWIIMLFSLVCILGTKTRSAWAVVGLLVLVYGLFVEKRYLAYLALASTIALLVPSIQERVLDLFQGNDVDAFVNDYEALNSYAWRKVIWASAMEQFWERPWWGFGYEGFTYYSGAFFVIESDEGAGAHNTYVQLLFEIGIIGFIAFLWLLIPILKKLLELRRLAPENIIVFALFLAYCLIHYSDNVFDYLVFNWYFWFFIGAFLAYNRLEARGE